MWEESSAPSSSAAGTTQPSSEADRGAEHHRKSEGDDPERDDGAAVDADQGEVELDPGHEHQVEQAQLPEVGDRRVAGADQVEPVGADHEAADQ